MKINIPKSWTVRKQIILSFSLLFLILVVGGLLTTNGIFKVRTYSNEQAQAFKDLQLFVVLKEQVLHTNLGYMDAIVDKNGRQVDEDIIENHHALLNLFKQFEDDYKASLVSVNSLNYFNLLKEKIYSLHDNGTELFQSIEGGASIAKFEKLDDSIDSLSDNILKTINEITLRFSEISKISAENSTITLNSMVQSQIIVFCLILAFCVIIGSLLNYNINSTLNSVVNQINLCFKEISNESNSLKLDANKMFSEISSNAARVEEMTATSEVIADHAGSNSIKAERANQLSKNSVIAMENGKNKIVQLSNSISEISLESKKMDEIISTIEEIAFQINLLALNAAVEAARAGEHGRGFAVVAESVRNLAMRTTSSAKDITKLIRSNLEKIEKCSVVSIESSQSLHEIESVTHEIEKINSEVFSQSTEQALQLTQLTIAVKGVDESIQENSSMTEKNLHSAEKLSIASEDLESVVFKINQLTGS